MGFAIMGPSFTVGGNFVLGTGISKLRKVLIASFGFQMPMNRWHGPQNKLNDEYNFTN